MKSKSGEIVMISDLSTAQPRSALADRPKEGCWYAMDYELADGTKGVMLTSDPHLGAAEVEIPLGLAGKYKIYVGVNYFMQCYEAGRAPTPKGYGSLWIKLTGDRGFSRIGAEKYDLSEQGRYELKILGELYKNGDNKESYNTVYEAYWKTADLTGQSLKLCPPKPPYNSEFYRDLANLTFIRLEPVVEKDIELAVDLEPRIGTKKMAVIWCSGALTGHTRGHAMYHPLSGQWFEDEFGAYRNSDFGMFCMEAIRGNLCMFPTEYGDVGTENGCWGDGWVDPLAEFTHLSHENGMKMFVSMRMIGGGRPNAFQPINWARFFWKHPHWAKRDKEGNLCSNVSLAFEGVRNHWLALLREALDYGIDGIVLLFNRSAPFVMYEEPALASFKEEHGIDPREIPEDDERWQRHVAGYVTQFVREIRGLLDEKSGRELAVICFKGVRDFAPGTVEKGSDPDTWIGEGLVDYMFLDSDASPRYIRHWKELGGGRVKVYPSLMPRRQPGGEYAKQAASFYENGADGFCVWDCERRIQRASEWAVVRHLGHRKSLKDLEVAAAGYYRFNRLKSLRGLNVLYSYSDG